MVYFISCLYKHFLVDVFPLTFSENKLRFHTYNYSCMIYFSYLFYLFIFGCNCFSIYFTFKLRYIISLSILCSDQVPIYTIYWGELWIVALFPRTRLGKECMCFTEMEGKRLVNVLLKLLHLIFLLRSLRRPCTKQLMEFLIGECTLYCVLRKYSCTKECSKMDSPTLKVSHIYNWMITKYLQMENRKLKWFTLVSVASAKLLLYWSVSFIFLQGENIFSTFSPNFNRIK